MMSESDKANYHNIIREMIKREDEGSRTICR